MFDPELLELMPLTCVLRPAGAPNGYGEPNYTGSVSAHCHVEYTGRQVYGGGNVSRTEEGVCYLDGVYDVDTRWGLEIPTPGGTRAVDIISVDQNTDEDGFHSTAVHFGAF